jgi:hypothetical protein
MHIHHSPSFIRYFVTELLGTDLHRLLTSRPLEKQFIQYFLYQILVCRLYSLPLDFLTDQMSSEVSNMFIRRESYIEILYAFLLLPLLTISSEQLITRNPATFSLTKTVISRCVPHFRLSYITVRHFPHVYFRSATLASPGFKILK